MTVNINGTTGVSLIQTGAVPSGTAIANGSFTGNVSITGASSYLNINGNNVSPYSGMMKNRIINGDFKIDQRFSSNANNNIAGFQYTVDRWYTYGTVAAKLRFQQNNTNGPGQTATQAATGFSRYFGANTVAANTVNAGDNWILAQAIEGFNIDDLDWGTSIAAPATLSFWVYSSIAGTHGGSIQNGNSDRSYPFQYTINTANTWQYQTITVPGDTTGSWFSNTSAGIYLVFSLGTGSNSQGTTNAWQSGAKFPTGIVQPVSAANGSFYLTGVQLEKGSQATPFEFRHYTTELDLCKRYYIKTNNSINASDDANCFFTCVTSTNQVILELSGPPMRSKPAGFCNFGNNSPQTVLWTSFAGSAATPTISSVNGASDFSKNKVIVTLSAGISRGYTGITAPGTSYGDLMGYFALSAELTVQN